MNHFKDGIDFIIVSYYKPEYIKLLVKSIKKYVNYFKNKQIPFLILDSWSELNNIKLSPELHEKIWGNFDSDTLLFDNYLMNLQIGEF